MTLSKPGYLPLYILGGVLFLIIAVLAFRAIRVLLSVKGYERYWASRAAEPVEKGDFQIVAIGDSTIQAIGATDPLDGVVGRVEEFVKNKTSRETHVFNVSRSGAKIGEAVKNQLVKVKDRQPDLVIVSIGANDAVNNISLDQYRQSYKNFVKTLPRDKTIYANTPDVANRPEYQKIFEEEVIAKGQNVAKVYENVLLHRNDPRVYGGDFFHPSGTGYGYWFNAFKPEVDEILKKIRSA
jgi:lysophospholipase L1-like esterase